MKRILIVLTMLGFGIAAQAQTHFVTAYSGNPYLAMNIYITEVTINGDAIEIGDEIGIFDGEICVGAAVVNSAFSPSSPLAMVASTDDPTTPETDGFVAGNAIQFRLWDESEQAEFADVTANYSLGEGTFSSQGTAMAALSVVGNQPPELMEIEDYAGQEDAEILFILQATDPDEDPLTFDAWTETPEVTTTVSNDTLWLTPALNWYGQCIVFVSASDGELTDTTDFLVTFAPVNDPPEMPQPLYPVEFTELDTNGVLIWSISHDVDVGDVVSYEVLLDIPTGRLQPSTESLMFQIEAPAGTAQDTAIIQPIRELPIFELMDDDMQCYWMVRAVDSQDTTSDWAEGTFFFFNKMNDAPDPPNSGFNPQDSVTVGSIYPSISWNAAFDQDYVTDNASTLYYELIVSDSWEFVDTLYQITTLPGQTSVTDEIGPVEDNSMLFYRVRTMDDEGLTSYWSEKIAFFINSALEPPMEFLLLSPSTGDSVAVDTTTHHAEVFFNWQGAIDPDPFDIVEYYFAFADTNTFALQENWTLDEVMEQINVVPLGQDTFFTTLMNPGKYAWTILAVDTDTLWQPGVNDAGEPVQFITIYDPTVGVNDEPPVIEAYQLMQNYPNPFNPTTQIRYALPAQEHVTINVYDVRGQRIATLVDAVQPAGWHAIEWTGQNLVGQQVSAGIYFYSIQVGAFSDLKKMVLVK